MLFVYVKQFMLLSHLLAYELDFRIDGLFDSASVLLFVANLAT
jgi:hypothetical protein